MRRVRLKWPRYIGSLLFISTMAVSSVYGASDYKRIAILHSFGQGFKPWSEYADRIRDELGRQSPWKLDIHDHSLVAARTGDQRTLSAYVEYLAALYSDGPPDLIISIGAPAANFVQTHRARLFPGTPMVLTAVEQRPIQWTRLTENDSVVAVAHDFTQSFESILHVLPATRTIVVINGASPNEKFWLGEMQREAKPFETRGIRFLWYENSSYEEILRDTARLPPDSAIFWHLMNVDAAGVAHNSDIALARLYETANAPIFSYDDTFFGRELVGGPMHSSHQGGVDTAAAAIRVLSGERPSDVKTPLHGYTLPRFDWRQLQRWKIPESALPPGSQVLFRDASIWDRYRWQVTLVGGILVLQALLIAGLLYERRLRHVAEMNARQRMSELAHVNRQATAGELTASIAHELAQPLGAIRANAETATLLLGARSPNLGEIREIVADILRDDERASDVITHLRGLLKKTPFALHLLDVSEIIDRVVKLLSAAARGRHVELRTKLPVTPLKIKGDAVQLEQVLLNLMLNAMDALMEADPSKREIVVAATQVDAFAEISVSDSGAGIPADKLAVVFEPFFTTKHQGMGMGLSIARTIVTAHNGHIDAENSDAGGAIFRIYLPLVGA